MNQKKFAYLLLGLILALALLALLFSGYSLAVKFLGSLVLVIASLMAGAVIHGNDHAKPGAWLG